MGALKSSLRAKGLPTLNKIPITHNLRSTVVWHCYGGQVPSRCIRVCCGSSLLSREIKALQESEDNHHVCFLVTCDVTSPVCVLVTVIVVPLLVQISENDLP